MPATISDILRDKAAPVTAQRDDTLQSVLAQMIQYDYSQLPVLDVNRKPVAMLTADSIVRALNNFSVAPVALRVFDARIAFLNFSFTRTRQLRIELYIDSGDQVKNKAIFDALYNQKPEIEAALGEPLSWERIDNKRASRVALYYQGTITDDKEKLTELRSRAVAAMLRFRSIIAAHLSIVIGEDKRG